MIKESFGTKAFNLANMAILTIVVIVTLYPIIYVLFASVSDPRLMVQHTGLLLKPLGFSDIGYKLLIQDAMIVRSFQNSAVILAMGVSVNISLTILGAYFLSRNNVYWKNLILVIILITMYFSGGLIPLYIIVKSYGLYNTYFALVLPGAISTINMIILRTAFAAVPESLEQSARIDGAGHLTVLVHIMLPLALPTIAVIGLYYSVAHWNAWFGAMIFLKERALYPLQLILREKLILNQTVTSGSNLNSGDENMVGETLKYAIIIISSIPMLCLYPFIQKYFVKGVMIGALKG